MKYLITAKRNTVEVPSTEEWLAILQTSKEYITAQFEDGAFECFYIYLPAVGGVIVASADSHEHVQEILLASPSYRFYDWEVKPVLEWLPTYDRFIDYTQQQLD